MDNKAERVTTQLENGNGCALSRLVRDNRSANELRQQLDLIREIHQRHRTNPVPGRYIPQLEISFENNTLQSDIMVRRGTYNIFSSGAAETIYKARVDHTIFGPVQDSCTSR